eukprot:624637-Pleurochrysis_carterae.AAC.2
MRMCYDNCCQAHSARFNGDRCAPHRNHQPQSLFSTAIRGLIQHKFGMLTSNCDYGTLLATLPLRGASERSRPNARPVCECGKEAGCINAREKRREEVDRTDQLVRMNASPRARRYCAQRGKARLRQSKSSKRSQSKAKARRAGCSAFRRIARAC